MSFSTTVLVVAGSASQARCRHCHQAIYWAVLPSMRRGQKPKSLPFNQRAANPDEVETERGLILQHWPSTLIHRCQQRPQPTTTTRAHTW